MLLHNKYAIVIALSALCLYIFPMVNNNDNDMAVSYSHELTKSIEAIENNSMRDSSSNQPDNPDKQPIDDTNENNEENTHSKNVILPATATNDPADTLEINFENTDLQNLINWVSDVFAVNFLTDDALNPLPAGGKNVSGNKITFKTHKPLTKKNAWDLFITFLDVFGFALIEGSVENFYKIVSSDPNAPRSANKSPLPSFINTNWQDLPDSEIKIRYAYYVRNTNLATIQSIVDSFRSSTSSLKALPDLNAFILTDKSFNIRSIMKIVSELDSSSLPESMSVLKLKHADAEDVKNLYESLTKKEDTRGLAARLMGTKKLPTTVYFPEDLRVFAERRSNTLIIFGTQEGIDKLERFILNYVDTELKIPYSPLYIYELQYTKAEDIATILTNVTKFAPESPASQSGGVRDGNKYLRPMVFQAEPSGNRLLINAEKEDYLKVLDVIKQLDVKQPQVAIEVLIVNVISSDDRELGIQIRNKTPTFIGKNIDFQSSGLGLGGGASASPVVDPTTGSLLGNLIQLAQNQTPGATLLTISNLATGVWGILRVLQTEVDTNVISNPFLVTTNNYSAQVSLGETRRVKTGVVQSQQSSDTFGDISANLTVQITPLINNEGNINLNINISIDAFTDTNDPASATKNTNTIKTNANVGNRQVLALGGLLKSNEVDITTKVPGIGDIPIFGWIFKNKTKIKSKNNLLVFISPRIVEPKFEGGIDTYSREKTEYSKQIMREMRHPAERRDVIHRWFFKDKPNENTQYVDNFVAKKYQADNYDISRSSFYPNNSTCIPDQVRADDLPVELQKVCLDTHDDTIKENNVTLKNQEPITTCQKTDSSSMKEDQSQKEVTVSKEPLKVKKHSLIDCLPDKAEVVL